MIEALVHAGWIDRSQYFRLVVHDWHEHADDSVHMKLARTKMYFVRTNGEGVRPKTARLSSKERDTAEKWYDANPMPCAQMIDLCAQNGSLRAGLALPFPPLPFPPIPEEPLCATEEAFALVESSPELKNGNLSIHQQEWFAAWWKIYWRKVARKPAEKAFRKHVRTQQRFEQVMQATKAQTPMMMGREPEKRPHGASWLNAERWEDERSQPARAAPKGNVAGLSVMQRERKEPSVEQMAAAHRHQAKSDADPKAREYSVQWLTAHNLEVG